MRALGASLLACMIACAQAGPPEEATFLIRDVRVFDGEIVLERQSVLVEAGRIARIGRFSMTPPRGVPVVDGRGHTLLPGLIDAHVHLSDSVAADLRQALALGVTTVLDMFTGGSRFDQIKGLRSADSPGLAAVRTAGVGATAPGGHPSQMGGPPFPMVADSAEAEAFVRARAEEGSDYLKIIYDDLGALGGSVPILDRPTLAGLIAAAHERGMVAVVHVLTEEQAHAAIGAGADGLAHLFFGVSPSPALASLVAGRSTFIIPTLSLLHQNCGQSPASSLMADTLLWPYVRTSLRPMMSWVPGPRESTPRCVANTDSVIRALVQLGVPILAGTDAPVPGLTYGASLHGELAALVAAGLTPGQALTAATSAPARAFRLTDRGRIAPGLRADLVLVEGNPVTDILATRRIAGVWKRGIRANRQRYEQ